MYQHLIPQDIPADCILGINYSGMHDSAIAIVTPSGEPVFAVSLERLSRVKQDGRYPTELLSSLPWEKISQVAFSVESEYSQAESFSSHFLETRLHQVGQGDRSHQAPFFKYLADIDKPKVYIPHHLSHAASAFWPSRFERALCLVYDGGMANEDWFGGVYLADRDTGIKVCDQFAAHQYANVTYLYSAITGILGFSPLKHEGKITGLAAYGKEDKDCLEELYKLLAEPLRLDGLSYWVDMYSEDTPPVLQTNTKKVAEFREQLGKFSREDLAFNVQKIAEDHILAILCQLKEKYPEYQNVCLSGGLFANVKINQRVSELGFSSVFVSPPMSDDGTALGAAIQAASVLEGFSPQPMRDVFLGPVSSKRVISELVEEKKVQLHKPTPELSMAQEIARLLAADKIVAIYQGASEFGPRALGNRSILASASDAEINRRLNNRLNRTEFMPFAPMCLAEDANELFDDIENNYHTAQFMTITVNCKPIMKERCPAVVHCDGTARPQLVVRDVQPLIHGVISSYKKQAARPAIVNTSFNVHEEPIVCTAEDALKGFFESGLDYLYLDGVLISLTDNKNIEAGYLREKIADQAATIKRLKLRELELHGLYSVIEIENQSSCQTVESLGGELGAMISERDEWHQKFAEKCSEYIDCNNRLQGVENLLVDAHSETKAKVGEAKRLHHTLGEAEYELERLNSLLDDERAKYDRILKSFSWRLLAPFRAVVNLFKK